MCPRCHLGVTVRPERLAPAQASLQTHATPVDIPDGPAPALWPYWLHSAKQEARLSWAMFSSIHKAAVCPLKTLSSYIILNLEWVIKIYEKKISERWEKHSLIFKMPAKETICCLDCWYLGLVFEVVVSTLQLLHLLLGSAVFSHVGPLSGDGLQRTAVTQYFLIQKL